MLPLSAIGRSHLGNPGLEPEFRIRNNSDAHTVLTMNANSLILLLRRTVHHLKQDGPIQTGRLVGRNILIFFHAYVDARFDKKHNVDTAGRVDLENLQIDSVNKERGEYYEPTPLATFKSIMKLLPDALDEFVFVDFGSGKGRALFAAAEFRFKKIIGVEFSPKLCEIAQKNLETFKNKKQSTFNIEILCLDACEFEFPNEDYVLYFNNPFDEVIFEEIIGRIANFYRKYGRKIYVVYLNPVSAHKVKASGIFRTLADNKKVFDLASPYRRGFSIFETVS